MMILNIHPTHQNTPMTISILDGIRHLFENHHKHCIADSFGSHIIILSSYSGNRTLDDLLIEELNRKFSGEGSIQCYSLFNNLESAKDFRSAYVLYCDSIDITCKIYPLKKFYTDREIHFANQCLSIINNSSKKKAYLNLLHPIIEDSEADLVLTLTTYMLDADSEVKKTAELLFVHRNTIQYRLSKIRNLIHMDFNKMPMNFDVYTAVALNRILPQ